MPSTTPRKPRRQVPYDEDSAAGDGDERQSRTGFFGVSVRACLQPGCSQLVQRGRCPAHTPTTTQRGYGADWQKVSKAAREAQPWCSVCGSPDDLTTDHTTGMVVCRPHHHSEAHGGVARSLRDRGASKSWR